MVLYAIQCVQDARLRKIRIAFLHIKLQLESNQRKIYVYVSNRHEQWNAQQKINIMVNTVLRGEYSTRNWPDLMAAAAVAAVLFCENDKCHKINVTINSNVWLSFSCNL